MPTVGIVIPVIDIDLHFLPDCLAAIRRMDPKPDSVLVVHDGTQEVFNALDPTGRFRYIRTGDKPGGTGRALNRGFSATETDWLITFGADDRVKPDFIKRINAADQSCDILAVAYNAITPGDPNIRLVQPRRVTPENVREGNVGIPEFSPFKRHIWERFPIDEDQNNHMDGALMFLQAILAGYKVGYVREACLDFMVRSDSKWHRLGAPMEKELREAMLRKAGLSRG